MIGMNWATLKPGSAPGAVLVGISFFAIALAGCMGGADATPASSIHVKDALSDDVKQVHVTFSRVEAAAHPDGAWIVAFEGERSIELRSLNASDAREKLGDLDLAQGEYRALRISVSDAWAVLKNDTRVNLTVAGNQVTIERAFNVTAAGIKLIVDFDLDQGVLVQAGLFTPAVADVQSDAEDADGNGVSDFDDTDDDGDGVEDAEDDDRNGDNRTDRPVQRQHNWFGLCTAWHASENARQQANSTMMNSSAFQRLHQNASAANETVEKFCDAQSFPGASNAIPEHAQQARDRAMQRRHQASGNGGGNQTGGPDNGGAPPGQGGQGHGQGGAGGGSNQTTPASSSAPTTTPSSSPPSTPPTGPTQSPP